MYLSPQTANAIVPPTLNALFTPLISQHVVAPFLGSALSSTVYRFGAHPRWQVLAATSFAGTYVVNRWWQARSAWFFANSGSKYKIDLEVAAMNGLRAGLASSLIGAAVVGSLTGVGYLNYLISSALANTATWMVYPTVYRWVTASSANREEITVALNAANQPAMSSCYASNCETQTLHVPSMNAGSYIASSNDAGNGSGPGGKHHNPLSNVGLEGWLIPSWSFGSIG